MTRSRTSRATRVTVAVSSVLFLTLGLPGAVSAQTGQESPAPVPSAGIDEGEALLPGYVEESPAWPPAPSITPVPVDSMPSDAAPAARTTNLQAQGEEVWNHRPPADRAQVPAPKKRWEPTENPNATVKPGEMRSDSEEIPEGFTKADADRAEQLEARLAGGTDGVVGTMQAAGCEVYWPAPYEVCGRIRDKYNALGGPNSFLLFPKTNEITNPDGVGKRTEFQNGPIYWSPQGDAHPVVNHFLAAWARKGYEAGYIGYPTTDEIVNPDGIGRRQEFTGAAIYWRLNEAYSIGGAIRDKWNSSGAEQGPLGYPISDETDVVKNNGRYNNFENGTITWSQPTGARQLSGPIAMRWHQLGREDGLYGYPIADEATHSDGIGQVAEFENGNTIWSTALTGARDMTPMMVSVWNSLGGPAGVGYPTVNLISSTAGAISQVFQWGHIKIDDSLQVAATTFNKSDQFVGGISAPSAMSPGPTVSEAQEGGPTDTAMRQDELNPYDVVGSVDNPLYPQWNPLIIRRGYWNDTSQHGFGMDKAGYYHWLHDVDSVRTVLRSENTRSRQDLQIGRVFVAYASTYDCSGFAWWQTCETRDWREVLAVYDPTSPEDGTYWNVPLQGYGGVIGLVTAYCADGNTDMSYTNKCDDWVDRSLQGPYMGG